MAFLKIECQLLSGVLGMAGLQLAAWDALVMIFVVCFVHVFIAFKVALILLSVAGILHLFVARRIGGFNSTTNQFLQYYLGYLVLLSVGGLYIVFQYHVTPLSPVNSVSLGLCHQESGSCVKLFARSPLVTYKSKVFVHVSQRGELGQGCTNSTETFRLPCAYNCSDGQEVKFARELGNLQPGCQYSYSVHGFEAEELHVLGEGVFTAIGLVRKSLNKSVFRFSSSSCAMASRGIFPRAMEAFGEIAMSESQFMLFLGDAIYIDVPGGLPTVPSSHLFAARYQELLKLPNVDLLLRSMPVVWQYDDHEIVDNYDDGKDTELFQVGYGTWREYLGYMNPPAVEQPNVSGEVGQQTSKKNNSKFETYKDDQECADKYSPEECTAELEDPIDRLLPLSYMTFDLDLTSFFILDTRMYQSPSASTMLGSEQLRALLQWICEPLQGPVRVKFLVSPQPWTLNYGNGWALFPVERSRILDEIEKCGMTKATILISGDQHRPGIYEPRPGLLEISASPIEATSSVVPFMDHNTGLIDPVRFESSGHSHVYAQFEVQKFNDTDRLTVHVEIIAGGLDIAIEILVFLLYSLSITSFIAAVPRREYECRVFSVSAGMLFLIGGGLMHIYFTHRLESIFEMDIDIP